MAHREGLQEKQQLSRGVRGRLTKTTEELSLYRSRKERQTDTDRWIFLDQTYRCVSFQFTIDIRTFSPREVSSMRIKEN